MGSAVRERARVDVGMVATEDRTASLGGCRRPLGGRSVRHSAGFVGLKESVEWVEWS
jgi:hypothetical protein